MFALQSLAAEVAAALDECPLYLFMLIPARANVHFNHLAIVFTLALMCGTSKVINKCVCVCVGGGGRERGGEGEREKVV